MVVMSGYRIDFASIQSVRPGARTVTVKLRCSTCFGWEGGGGGGGRRDKGWDGRRVVGEGWRRDGGEGWWDVCWRDADARDGPAPLSYVWDAVYCAVRRLSSVHNEGPSYIVHHGHIYHM